VTRMHEISCDGLSWTKADTCSEFFPGDMGASNSDIKESSEPEPEPEAEQTLTAPNAPGDGEGWYAHIEGRNEGPVSKNKLTEWIASGSLQRDSLVWRSEYENWQPAETVLGSLFPQVQTSTRQQEQNDTVNKPIQTEPQRHPNGDLPSGFAITSMILGILSLVLCTNLITGVPAVIFGGLALSRANKGLAGGKGMAITGLATGIIGCVIGITGLIYYLVAVMMIAGGSAMF
ncbi:GYF domain-containing protein, partial [Rhodopirellula sp.]|nr:GYF domain-containing protein [Rhodopirellula sp.]